MNCDLHGIALEPAGKDGLICPTCVTAERKKFYDRLEAEGLLRAVRQALVQGNEEQAIDLVMLALARGKE